MQTFDKIKDMPAGLRMALTRNIPAMGKFSAMAEADQAAFVQGARQVRSKQEMQGYVSRLSQE